MRKKKFVQSKKVRGRRLQRNQFGNRPEPMRVANPIESKQRKPTPWVSFVELFPYGVTFSMGGARPVFILKSQDEKSVLPVWMNPIDANMAMADSNISRQPHVPHKVSLKIIEEFGLSVRECRFVALNGHQHQVVQAQARQGLQLGT